MILSNISVPLLSAVDTALLGHLDDAVFLGAVAVGGSILTLVFWSFGFLRMGTTSLTAQAFGAKDLSQCRLVLAQSIILACGLALLLILGQALIFPIALTLMEPSPEVSALAASYCEIRILSAPATLINYALIGWFIGLQNTRIPLLIMVSTNCLNIVLNCLFILVLDMKSDGAAIATVIAEYTGLTIALIAVSKVLRKQGGQLNTGKLKELHHYRALLLVNRHLFIRTACLLFSLSFFTSQGARQGDEILAANAILMQLLMLSAYGLDGFAHAAEALAGKAIGARKVRLFFAVCKTTSYWALISALLITLCYVAAEPLLISLFSDIKSVTSEVTTYYNWLLILPLISMGCYQLDGIFIGAGKSRGMRDAMLFATFAIFLPLWWLSQAMGNHGLWLAFTGLNLARSLTMFGLFIFYTRRQRWFAA